MLWRGSWSPLACYQPGWCSSSPWCWWRGPGTCPSGCGGGSPSWLHRPRHGTSWVEQPGAGHPHPRDVRGVGCNCPSQLSWQWSPPTRVATGATLVTVLQRRECATVTSWQWWEGEDNVRTGDSYVVTVGTHTDHSPRSVVARETSRVLVGEGPVILQTQLGSRDTPATGQSQHSQHVRHHNQPPDGLTPLAEWGTNGLGQTRGGSLCPQCPASGLTVARGQPIVYTVTRAMSSYSLTDIISSSLEDWPVLADCHKIIKNFVSQTFCHCNRHQS